ncbi:hypothetical protein ALO40_200167 [Pseudomonas syringae pv. viburni]|uniref:Uncharacterized protein n=2 Tax=Pseudomonas syringae group genomosp. 3 TaxID=251701 RepID=A0A0Q0EN87_9PSED|nr:hypothetical protein ALO40_200167 [Pseudomonas syringae pv. viburni]
MLGTIKRCFFRWINYLLPVRRLQVVQGDVLPTKMPFRDFVLVKDGIEDWCVGFSCPCGCGKTIELLLPLEMEPRWTCKVDTKARPTLHPSVWLKSGCKSHFWVREGRIIWV